MIDEKKLIEELEKIFETDEENIDCTLSDFAYHVFDCIKAQPKVGEWIPIKYHETTDDDGIDKNIYPLFLDCKMPDNGQDILICTKGGLIGYDTCFDDDGYYLDSSFDWIDDVVAWMPLPEPYKGE